MSSTPHLTLAFCLASLFAQAVDPATPKPKNPPNYAGQISAQLQPTRSVVYQKVADRELHLDIFEPKDFKAADRRACFVALHGGGWTSGFPRVMYAFAAHCAELGMVGVSVQYRLYKAGSEVTVCDCVKDAGLYADTLQNLDAFFASLGFVKAMPSAAPAVTGSDGAH
jgi:acetyl esterase/lipase